MAVKLNKPKSKKLLKISNLSVSSASQEGLPVNILEAMYMEVPIIATNNRGHRELIDKELQYWPKFLIHKCK